MNIKKAVTLGVILSAGSLSGLSHSAEENVEAFKSTWRYKALTHQRNLTNYNGASQRYNILTHNSFNSRVYTNGALNLTYADPQQKLTMTGQLDAGVRQINMDVHWVNGDLRLCHDSFSGIQLVCSAGDRKFKDGIDEVVTWLRRPENKNEYVSIYIQREYDLNNADHRAAAARALLPYRNIIHSADGVGNNACLGTINDRRSIEQIVASGRRLRVSGLGGDCNSSSIVKKELGAMEGRGGSGQQHYSHMRHGHKSGGSRVSHQDVWNDDYEGFPVCRFGDKYPSDTQNTSPSTPHEDRTTIGASFHSGTPQHSAARIAAMVECGINLQWDDYSTQDTSRLDAYVWSWNQGEPNNYGGGEDCALLIASGKMNDSVCSHSHRFACQHVNNALDWKVTTAAKSWPNGENVCRDEFGSNYYYSVPKDGYEKNLLDAARDAIDPNAKVWLAYTDAHREGDWAPYEHPSVYWNTPWNSGVWATWGNGGQPDNQNGTDHCAAIGSGGNVYDDECWDQKKVLCYTGSGTAHGGADNWVVISGNHVWEKGESACSAINARFMMPADSAAMDVARARIVAKGGNTWLNFSDLREEGKWLASLSGLNVITRVSDEKPYTGPYKFQGFARLRNDFGKCIDVDGGDNSVKKGANVHQWSCDSHTQGNLSQLWKHFPDKTIRPFKNHNLCLDVAGAGTSRGTGVNLWTCNGTVAQVWEFKANNLLINPNSGKALDIKDPWGGNGQDTHLWDIDNESSQRFYWSVMDEYIYIRPKSNTSKCIDADSNNNGNVVVAGASISQIDCKDLANQRWSYNASTQQIHVRANPALCMDTSDGKSGTFITMQVCDSNKDTQRFNVNWSTITPASNTGKVFDVDKNTGRLHLYTDYNNSNQRFWMDHKHALKN